MSKITVSQMSPEGIKSLEELKTEYPKYSDVIDEIIKLSEKGYYEAVGVILILFNKILEKEKNDV